MHTLTLLDITAPHLEYRMLAPLIVLLSAACFGVLLEAVLPRRLRNTGQVTLAALALLAAMTATFANWHGNRMGIMAVGSITMDGPAYFAWTMELVFGLGALMMFAERRVYGQQSAFTPMAAAVPGSELEAEAARARVEHTEVYPLLMFSLLGMMLFSAADDLITMFVSLEIFSLPLYLLSGLSRRRRLLSQEAALKYFLLGALSSAFFVYGTALLYGYAGSFRLSAIDAAITANRESTGLLLAGAGLVIVSMLFKMGAVPFHSWVPDVYTGAPTAVTTFMATCTKPAAIAGLMRVTYVGLGATRWDWQPVMAVIAVLTMLVGALVAITQTDIKRLLAYSSIAHAGFILVGVVGAVAVADGMTLPGRISSVGAVLFYLTAYGFAALGAFAIVTMVRSQGGEATGLASWQGLARAHPVLAGVMTLFLLSMAGLPLTGGFIGKLAVFIAGWKGGYAWLVLVGLLCSVIAAFIYVRLLVIMWFRAPSVPDVEVVEPSILTWLVVWVSALATLVLGLAPAPVLNLAVKAAGFLR